MAETTSKTFKGCYNCGTLIDSTCKYCAYCGAEQHASVSVAKIQDNMAARVICHGCGEAVDREDARFCPVCGHEVVQEKAAHIEAPKTPAPAAAPATPAAPPKVAIVPVAAGIPAAAAKSDPLPHGYALNSKGKKVHRVTAGILSILLGSVGAPWFYIGKPALGVLSILTCWTGIPALVGFIHGIIYLTSKDEHFKAKYLP
jgi:TM2 domain-containing membrane protein YozV/RNA polymerase subunit RPABC4/transcription elongation factor Spt4